MTLNFSHRPVFPAHLPEENMVSPIRIANGDSFGRPCHSNREFENLFGFEGDRYDRAGGSQESVSNDILDLLPSDPFGMDISTTFTALTGWLEDLEVDYGGFGGADDRASDGSYQLFAELNLIWSRALNFQAFSAETVSDHNFQAFSAENVSDHKSKASNGFGSSSHHCSGSGSSVNQAVGVSNDISTIDSYICSVEDGEAPHSALSFSLAYLGLRDLLVVERVCRSLQFAVRGDSLLWRSIHIDQPLSEKITDDALLLLADRAQGSLQCLSLVECPRLTDDGLRSVLVRNLKLVKLSVPGSTRLSIEGIINSLKASKSLGAQGVKHIRIGGLYGVTMKHFEELKALLNTERQPQKSARKPHFYSRGNFYLSLDDDRDIDVEVCPKCHNLRLVYDCPLQACQGNNHGHGSQMCRACTLCIARCAECGRCIDDNEYEETFCLELLCSACLSQVAASDVVPGREVNPSS